MKKKTSSQRSILVLIRFAKAKLVRTSYTRREQVRIFRKPVPLRYKKSNFSSAGGRTFAVTSASHRPAGGPSLSLRLLICRRADLRCRFGFSLFLIAFLIFTRTISSAQVLELEKTYTLTGEAKNSALANASYDPAKDTYTLTYLAKSDNGKIKFEMYTFDRDFNFLNREEQESEPDKVTSRFSWFKWKGETYTVRGNYVEPDLLQNLVLKKKDITYHYNFLMPGYFKTVDILDKVKPKSDIGKRYFYFSHAEDDVTGDIYVLCGIKAGADDIYSQFRDMVILKFNAELEKVNERRLTFQYVQQIALVRALPDYTDDEDNPGVGGFVLVTAPMGGGNMDKVADPDKTNYTFLRLNKNLELTDSIRFKSMSSYWKIDEFIHDELSDDIYLFGPSAAGKDKYYNNSFSINKFSAVQLMKVSNHTLSYFTETNLDEFAAKLKTPPSQKRTPEYIGKKFETVSYKISPGGDFIVAGQNFEDYDKGVKYNDVVAFHFDNNGKLKSQYGIEIQEKNPYSRATGTPQFMTAGQGNNMFWFILEIKRYAELRKKLLTYPRVGKFDLETGAISEFISMGGTGDYYLDTKYPYLETDKGNTIVFFGCDRPGKTLWFARVRLE